MVFFCRPLCTYTSLTGIKKAKVINIRTPLNALLIEHEESFKVNNKFRLEFESMNPLGIHIPAHLLLLLGYFSRCVTVDITLHTYIFR